MIYSGFNPRPDLVKISFKRTNYHLYRHVFALGASNASSRKQGVWLRKQLAPLRTVCTTSFKNHEITFRISMTAFIMLYGHAGVLREFLSFSGYRLYFK